MQEMAHVNCIWLLPQLEQSNPTTSQKKQALDKYVRGTDVTVGLRPNGFNLDLSTAAASHTFNTILSYKSYLQKQQ
jgi:hypothetical protein